MAYALSLISPPAITTLRSRSQDPAPTAYDPNDPKGKQQAIHKAESFAEYLAKRNAGGAAVAAQAAAAAAPAAPSAPSVFKPPVDESAAKAAWLAKQGTKGQWGRAAAAAAVTGNVVASAPAAAPHGGKGFGGGEATRDPEPTTIDPNDPKGKQQAIHKAESFAEYLAKRA